MAEYEPGMVAVATVRGVPNVRVMRTDDTLTTRPWWVSVAPVGVGYRWHHDDVVRDIRPLTLLDAGGPWWKRAWTAARS